MLLTVLIPIFQLDSYRKRNLEFIYKRIINHYNESEIEIILGIQDEIVDTYYNSFYRAKILHCSLSNQSSNFNKSYIFNKCITTGINGQFLIFLDCDIYFPFQRLPDQLDTEDEVIRPFDNCIYLDKPTTDEFIKHKKTVASGHLRRLSVTGGGCTILNKTILSDLRMDENFYGWGYEDVDFSHTLNKKFDVKIIRQPAVHLYHDQVDLNRSNYEYYKAKYQYRHKTYQNSIINDTNIIIAYNDKISQHDIYRTIDQLKNIHCPITVVEAITPGVARLNLPNYVHHIEYNLSMHNIPLTKENLYNFAIKYNIYNKILLLNADVLFSNTNFIDECSSLLDNYDIIQPFDTCILIDKNYLPAVGNTYKHSICKSMKLNKFTDETTYKAGLSWGMTKSFIDSCGGLYTSNSPDNSLISDIVFSYAICPQDSKLFDKLTRYCSTNTTDQVFYMHNLYHEYRMKVQKTRPKIGYLNNCICYHNK